MTLALHWFRTDLRVHDNLALSAAQAVGPIVALYIATPQQWRMHDDALIKQDYWRRSLQALEAELNALGIPLLCFEVATYREVPVLFARLLPALQVTELHCNREIPVNEQLRDQAVAGVCRELAVRMTLHDDRMLIAPARVLNKSGEPFKVFTPYARAMRELLQGLPQAAALRRQQQPMLARLPERQELADLNWPAPKPQWERDWPAGNKSLSKQLDAFCQSRVDGYRTQRDLPAVNGTSRLSPALAAGSLSIRECWRRAALWHDGEGALTWQNELLWRDFYQYILWHYPRVCKKLPWREDVGHVPWRHDAKEFALWCEGRTGIPIIDAAMRQLQQTGWMHNRLRMVTAMFLTKHLLIDWRWGERWFMQNLIDGDLAANNGGWQWSASTGTDAVPYFRIFNPVTQSRRFDSEGAFIRQYVPELAHLDNKEIHDPQMKRPANYPPAVIDLAFGRERALKAFKDKDTGFPHSRE